MKEDIYNTDKKYQILYADPPWEYFTYSKKGKGRSAESHYPTMKKNRDSKITDSSDSGKRQRIVFMGDRAMFDRRNRAYIVLGLYV